MRTITYEGYSPSPIVISIPDSPVSQGGNGTSGLDVTLEDFGGIADGELNLLSGHTTGHDNGPALLQAIDVVNITGGTIILRGKYLCLLGQNFRKVIFAVKSRFRIQGKNRYADQLIFDDDKTWNGGSPSKGQTGNVCLGSSQFIGNSRDKTSNEYFIADNIGIVSTWWRDVQNNERQWSAATPYRAHGLAVSNTKYVEVTNCLIMDIMGFGSYVRDCDNLVYQYNTVRNVCADGLRAQNVTNRFVNFNDLRWIDDDAITMPADDTLVNALTPRDGYSTCIGNHVEQSEGILILGPKNVIVANNILKMTYGTGLVVYAFKGNTTNMGEGGFCGVIVTGNIVENHMRANARTINPDGSPKGEWGDFDTNAIVINGGKAQAVTTPSKLGDRSDIDVLDPYYNGDVAWGPFNAHDIVGNVGDAISGNKGTGLVMANNHVMRTLPDNAVRYSDFKRGEQHTRWGRQDPQVFPIHFALNGYKFLGEFDGADVTLGTIRGFRRGAAIFLADANKNMNYENFVLRGGTIIDVKHGIDCDAGQIRWQDITWHDPNIDCDPFRVQTGRASGNRWLTPSNSYSTAFHLVKIEGFRVFNAVIKNVCNPHSLQGGLVDNPTRNKIINCVLVAEQGNSGANNRGVRNIFSPYILENRDLTPGSPTFGKPQ